MTCDKSAARALHSPLHAQEGTSPGLADALPNVLNNDAIPGQASRTRDSLASDNLCAALASDSKTYPGSPTSSSSDVRSSVDSATETIAQLAKDNPGANDKILQKTNDAVGLDSIKYLQIKTADYLQTETQEVISGNGTSVLPHVATDTPSLPPTIVQEESSPVTELSQKIHDSRLSSNDADSQTPGKAHSANLPPRKPRHDSGCASGFFSDDEDSNPFMRRKKSKSSSSTGLSSDRLSSLTPAPRSSTQPQRTLSSSSIKSETGKRGDAMEPAGDAATRSINNPGRIQRRASDISTQQGGRSRPKSQFLDKDGSSFFSDTEDSRPMLRVRRKSSASKRPVEESGLFSGDEGETSPRRKKIARVKPTDYVRATLDNSKSTNNHFSLSSTRSAKSFQAERANMGILDDGDKLMKEVDDREFKDIATHAPNIHQGNQTKIQNTTPFLTGLEPEPLVRSMTAIGPEWTLGPMKLKKAMPFFSPMSLHLKDNETSGDSSNSRYTSSNSTTESKNMRSSNVGLMLPPVMTAVSGSADALAPSCPSASRPPSLKVFGRSQTMISRREEFMDTLESHRHAAIDLIQQGHRFSRQGSVIVPTEILPKVAPFAPPCYIPDPKVKECQILPCVDFEPKPNDSTRRVSPQTVVDVLEGKYNDRYDEFILVDCRFPYEYEGGHIDGSVNINTLDELEKRLLQPAITDKRVLLIFHCEFSCHRGPRMARHLRNQDRHANVDHYPALFYPEVYVMQSGYSVFFRDHQSHCVPEAYVPMDIVD